MMQKFGFLRSGAQKTSMRKDKDALREEVRYAGHPASQLARPATVAWPGADSTDPGTAQIASLQQIRSERDQITHSVYL
jgi:hypothetical protein